MPGPTPKPPRPADAVAALQAVLAASIAVPLLLLLGAALLSHQTAERNAWERVERIADMVREHATRVFQTHELVLDRIADRTRDMDWPAIRESRELHLLLKQLKDSSPQMTMIGMTEPDRRLAISDSTFPLPVTYAGDRRFLRVPRPDRDGDLFISETALGQYSGRQQFAVTRYKPNSVQTPSGGMIFVSVGPDYFAGYYRDIVGDEGVNVTMARADGPILSRFPEPPHGPTALPPSNTMIQQIAQGQEQGRFEAVSFVDGTDRLFVYKKLPTYPVYVSIGIQRSAVDAAWLRAMAGHLVYGVPATLALIATTLVALRRTRREHVALALARAEEGLRKQAEEETRQAQKMELIGRLTGGVAHDFNNLLTAVVGNLELLERHVSTTTGRRLLAAALRGVARGEQLTQSLLAFGRRQALRPELVNANRLIKEFGDLLRRGAGETIEVQFLLSPTLDPCLVDPSQFQSALLNLVVNARDAMANGGKITIQTENISFRANPPPPEIPPGDYIGIAIADTGEGMAPEVLERAFEPFFTTKEVGKGSGLGLSQVYGFVKQSGGYVGIDSEPAVGTTIRLYLPRSTTPAAPGSAPVADAAPDRTRGHGTILLVEDDADVREVVAIHLRELGYRVLSAADGREALAILQRADDAIDVLFTDLVMPNGMRGDELARRARQRRPDLRVVLTSGYPASVEPQDWQETGADVQFLPKPYKAEDLARVIGEALAAQQS